MSHAPEGANQPLRQNYLLLSPAAARLLSVLSVGGMHLWFLMKFFLAEDRPILQILVGLCALTGIIGCIVMFVCTYNFVAQAPDHAIDERELAERNAAYFKSFQYVVVMVLLGYLGCDLLSKVFGYTVSIPVVQNFLLLTFLTAMIMPATLLAWNDRPLPE